MVRCLMLWHWDQDSKIKRCGLVLFNTFIRHFIHIVYSGPTCVFGVISMLQTESEVTEMIPDGIT